MPQEHILIIGAGLAGSLLACRLANLGYRVSIFERRPDPRRAGYAGGRSINLALSVRGIDALARARLAERVLKDAIPMRGRMVHPTHGDLAFQPYSKDQREAINSVSRAGLNLTLLNAAAEHESVSLHFDCRCVDIDPDTPLVTLEGPDGTFRVPGDVILGADGAFSAVRTRLQKNDRFELSQSFLAHGYKELHIPPAPDGRFALEPNALHIWPRRSAMMIALPNTDRSFTCTLFWPFDGPHSFANLKTPDDVLAFFASEYPDAVPRMPSLAEDFLRNPTSSLVTIRCAPWHHAGRVMVLGDAAHAIVPFYGQGMNCAFEDVTAFLDTLEQHRGDFAKTLPEVERLRKPHADAIADMALDNFVEMRDKVGSPGFLARKKVEQAIHELFPDLCTPQYNLVSFSTTPYAQARAQGRRMDAILDRVLPCLSAEPASPEWREQLRAAAQNVLGGRASDPPLHDLSPLVNENLKVWPGDTAPSRQVLCDIAKGDSVTLSTLHATVHLGSHADAPTHYGHPDQAIDSMPLRHYVGRCQVISARVARGERVRPQDLSAMPSEPRVLIRTCSFPDPTRWNNDFAALSPELIEHFHTLGVITIGIDSPSVDLMTSKDLPAHKAFLACKIAILEGLVLEGVADGVYELLAPPLRLAHFDASPVRAILRPL